MDQTRWRVALPCGCLLVAVVGTACHATDAAVETAAGAGNSLEIRVDAPVPEALGPWPMGAGVPLPKGRMQAGDTVRLRGQRQGVLPVQLTKKTRWPDGSVQWTWLDFQGDPRDRYFLDVGSTAGPAPAVAVRVAEDDAGLSVDSGVLAVTWTKSFGTPTRIRAGRVTSEGDGQGIYVVDQRGRRAVLGGPGAELAWKIEAFGPLRAVIRVEGWYVTAEGERVARSVVRYHLYAGRAFFTMDHTFVFTEDTDRLWFKEVAVRFPWRGSDSARARFGVQGAGEIAAPIGDGGEAWIFQDDYPHFAQKRAHFACGSREGEVAGGWCEAGDGRSAVTLVVQDMARQFPKELAADRLGVTARLWSNRGGKELDYRPGTLADAYYGNDWIGAMKKGPVNGEPVPCDAEGFRKLNPSGLGSARTHFLLCAYHAAPPEPRVSPDWAAAFDAPPVALADPAWLCSSGALWRVAAKDEKRFPEAEQFISRFFDLWLARMSEFPMNGWIGRGVGPELSYQRRPDGRLYAAFYRLNNVAAYNTPKNVWVGYYRSGERKFLDFAEPYTRFLADFATLHWGGGREKKQKGLIVTGMGPFPLYWAGAGTWETRGASTDFLVPLRLAWLLRDCRWARDCLERYAAAMNESWDLEKCRRHNAPFTHLSMMLNAYGATEDPRLAEKLHKLADALVDLNDPLGFSVAFYRRKLAYPYDATYKYERKILALLDYYDTFGVEKAKRAVIKANEELFAAASQIRPVAYQNYMPVHLARCFEWTGNRDYRSAAAAHLDTALEWFREFAASEGSDLSAFAPDKQGFPFFTVPHLLALVSDPGYAKQTYPYLANLGREAECPIYLVKEKDREASILVSVISALAESLEVAARVVGPEGAELAGCVRQEPMHRRAVYRVTIPRSAAAGVYRVSMGKNRFLVIGSTVDKLVLGMPEGTFLGHRDTLGYALTRNKPYYFQVPEGQAAFTIRVSHPLRMFDPEGRLRDDVGGKAGRLTVAAPKPGLWSFVPGAAACVQFEDLPPVVAFAEKSRFFVPAGIEKPKIALEWQAPRSAGLVEGRFGRGLHIAGGVYKARWGRASDFPGPQGTVEFFFRPDWSSRWLKEAGPRPFWTAPPLTLTYRNQPQREGNASFYTWLQFHPAVEERGFGWVTRAEAYASFEAGRWNHLACTWTESAPRYVIYLNGAKVGELPDPNRYNRLRLEVPERRGDGTLTLGPWSGTYDEFRMSSIVRYAGDFRAPAGPFAEDRDTLLLFHFDEDLRAAGRGSGVELVKP